MHTKYGVALTECREMAGYPKQTAAARASAKLAKDLPEHFEAFSQQWLSRLEKDRTGTEIDRSVRPKLRTLAYLLKLNGKAFEERIGVSIGQVPLLDQGAETRSLQRLEGVQSLRGDLVLTAAMQAEIWIEPGSTTGMLVYQINGEHWTISPDNPIRPEQEALGSVVKVEFGRKGSQV
ncbi:hypothetical protein [Deinococcus roseus]|uniref:Uncharacterized protein n=1 Tax=Deinococcus roseus TaxID=392414 RepID=A0ABQ2DCC3_9DEIO|nr:hypothetical protein [Deinococcus roseus]GGJ53171.1 hypothetical protein GCM10008938_43940 [Deinococcus roseus]